MILKSYIDRGTDYTRHTQGYVESVNMPDDFLMDNDYRKLSIFESNMDISPEDMSFYTEESDDKSFIERIGDKIKEIFEKIKKMISNFIDKIKSLGFEGKSTIDKFETFKKEYPDYASQMKVAIDNGEIDISVMRSIGDLRKAYDEIERAAKKKDAEESVLKSKWEKAKDNFEMSANKWTIATSIVTLAAAVLTFGPRIVKARGDAEKSQADRKKRERNIMRLKEENNTDPIPVFLAKCNYDLTVAESRGRRTIASSLAKLNVSIKEAMNKHTSNSTKQKQQENYDTYKNNRDSVYADDNGNKENKNSKRPVIFTLDSNSKTPSNDTVMSSADDTIYNSMYDNYMESYDNYHDSQKPLSFTLDPNNK